MPVLLYRYKPIKQLVYQPIPDFVSTKSMLAKGKQNTPDSTMLKIPQIEQIQALAVSYHSHGEIFLFL